jgi:septum formation protein
MLILASASIGYRFEIRPAQIPEDPRPGELPEDYVKRLAREKAEVVFHDASRNAPHVLADDSDVLAGNSEQADPSLTVLGADTTVTLDGAILGKPANAADAARMLRRLSGRTHRVITGVAVVTADETKVAAEVTKVQFLAMSEAEIAAYIATGEPMDKAGAYGIQGRAARWIPRVEGCYFNVMGLPLARVCAMLGPGADSDRLNLHR